MFFFFFLLTSVPFILSFSFILSDPVQVITIEDSDMATPPHGDAGAGPSGSSPGVIVKVEQPVVDQEEGAHINVLDSPSSGRWEPDLASLFYYLLIFLFVRTVFE